LMISSSLLVIVLAGGLVVSRSALVSARDAALVSENDQHVLRSLDRVVGLLGSASRATLEAMDAGGMGPVAVQDGVVYDNLEFRRATGFELGALILEPPVAQPPMRLILQPDPAGGQNTFLVDLGGRQLTLCRGVRDLEIRQQGGRLQITLEAVLRGSNGTRSQRLTRSLMVRTP